MKLSGCVPELILHQIGVKVNTSEILVFLSLVFDSIRCFAESILTASSIVFKSKIPSAVRTKSQRKNVLYDKLI